MSRSFTIKMKDMALLCLPLLSLLVNGRPSTRVPCDSNLDCLPNQYCEFTKHCEAGSFYNQICYSDEECLSNNTECVRELDTSLCTCKTGFRYLKSQKGCFKYGFCFSHDDCPGNQLCNSSQCLSSSDIAQEIQCTNAFCFPEMRCDSFNYCVNKIAYQEHCHKKR